MFFSSTGIVVVDGSAVLCQTRSQVLASDPVVPLGAESSRAHEQQEADVSPNLPAAEEVTCSMSNCHFNNFLFVFTPVS